MKTIAKNSCLKRLCPSALLSLALLAPLPLSAEDKGWFIGLSLGGSLATNAMLKKDLNPAPGGAGGNAGNLMLSTGVSLGARLGYQAFYTNRSGIRFYISGITTAGIYPDLANAANSDLPLVLDLYILADMNADYLFNWATGGNYDVGLFAGFFGGTLTGLPILTPNPAPTPTIAITAGVNFGIRMVLNRKHQVELGLKGGAAIYLGRVASGGAGGAPQPPQQPAASDLTNIGGLVHLGASYNYRF